MNKTLSVYRSIGVMNRFGEIYCSNWLAPVKWGAIEVGTGSLLLSCLSLLSELHMVVLCSLFLWYCNGQRLDLYKNLKIVCNSLLICSVERKT